MSYDPPAKPLVVKVRPKCGEVVAYPVPRTRSCPIRRKEPNIERSSIEAARRARSRVRLLATEHRCNRLLTLTFRDAQKERSQVVKLLQAFFRKVKARLPRLQWVAVLELHSDGEKWHVHMAVNKWVAKEVWADIWGNGFIDVRRIKSKHGGNDPDKQARAAAAYLAKYIAKGADEENRREAYDHRYFHRQGMRITEIEAEADGWVDAKRVACRIMGKAPSYEWCSWDCTDGSEPVPYQVVWWVF